MTDESARERSREILSGAGPGERWAALAQLGFFGALGPEELGGNGAGARHLAAVFEELAATGVATVLPGFSAIIAGAVARGGAPELHEEVLPRLLAGERRVAIAATEEEAGFDLFGITTRLRRDGEGFLLDGGKTYCSGADEADELFVVARTRSRGQVEEAGLPKTAGLTVALVPADSEGVGMEEMATRGEGHTRQYRLTFDGVFVPAHRILGEVDRGAEVLFPSFNLERLLFAAMSVGIARFCLGVACEQARERRVFGDTPVGAYQAVQHPLADARIRQEAVSLLVRRVARGIDAGEDLAAVARDAMFAKYLASELARKVVDAAMEAMGGRGFDEEHGVIQLLETARLLKLSPVSDSLVLNDVAARVLGLPRSR